MGKIIKRKVIPPLMFELLGLTLVFAAYLLAGGQDRQLLRYSFSESVYRHLPQYFLHYGLAVLGTLFCCWALVRRVRGMIERKQEGKEIFFDGVDALMTAPLMLLLGARIFKWKLSLSFFMEIEIEPDVFNTLSLVFIGMALVTGSLGFVSMFLEPQRNKV